MCSDPTLKYNGEFNCIICFYSSMTKEKGGGNEKVPKKFCDVMLRTQESNLFKYECQKSI